jgi:transposase
LTGAALLEMVTLRTGGNSPREESTRPRSSSPYVREFREEGVRLVRSSGRPIAQIARELGDGPRDSDRGVKQAELDPGLRAGLTTAERELRRLRREVRILRGEREIRTPPREVGGTS